MKREGEIEGDIVWNIISRDGQERVSIEKVLDFFPFFFDFSHGFDSNQ